MKTSSRTALENAGARGRDKDRMKILALAPSTGAADAAEPRLEEFVVHPSLGPREASPVAAVEYGLREPSGTMAQRVPR